MDSRKLRNLRNNFDRTKLDKQVDKIFETGRQFVDGVSGTRPGKRKNSDFQGISRKNIKNVGRWVTDKMDLFFEEEEDDWYEDETNFEETREIKSFKRGSNSFEGDKSFSKRPLEALSLRQTKKIHINDQKRLPYAQYNSFDEWPDDLDLKVERWQRSSEKNTYKFEEEENQRSGLSKGRNLPRSRIRRI